MCTITFIPQSNNNFILTSNRDEAPARETFPPKMYEENGVKLLYPKDAVAGGTWIGISGKMRIICLMNGGFVAHERKQSYGKSRGVVAKEFLAANNLKIEIEKYDFKQIEPFTAVFIEWKDTVLLLELVWDGSNFHFNEKPLTPTIWSSSPLYPVTLKNKRVTWFSDFIMKTEVLSKEKILHFHKTGGEGDLSSNLIMDRGFIKTKSITQISKQNEIIEMRYEDLQTEEISYSVFNSQT